mmetsp:Transcript_18497/g.32944  ORF Transcript_18497/g.32944 Transcript_18497/m.32944 type:complete len:232 (-) Transcript_18497:294-989(-)
MRSSHSPQLVSMRTFTLVRCAMAGTPFTSGRKRVKTPKSLRSPQWLSFGSQSLNSPTRHIDLHAGAHSRYQMPRWPSFSPRLSPKYLYPRSLVKLSMPPSCSSIALRMFLYTPQRYLKCSAWLQRESSHLRQSVPSCSGISLMEGSLDSSKMPPSQGLMAGLQLTEGPTPLSVADQGPDLGTATPDSFSSCSSCSTELSAAWMVRLRSSFSCWITSRGVLPSDATVITRRP